MRDEVFIGRPPFYRAIGLSDEAVSQATGLSEKRIVDVYSTRRFKLTGEDLADWDRIDSFVTRFLENQEEPLIKAVGELTLCGYRFEFEPYRRGSLVLDVHRQFKATITTPGGDRVSGYGASKYTAVTDMFMALHKLSTVLEQITGGNAANEGVSTQ